MYLKFLCIWFGLFLCHDVSASNWKYKGKSGPQDWDVLNPACGMSSQSPVNIMTSSVVPDDKLGFLQLMGYDQSLATGQFVNNGHTVQLNFPKGKVFRLSGNGIDGTYTALQLHFHWRAANSSINGGSEHSVNGHFFDAEMHIVHIKDPYTSLDQIKNMSDGLAVLGIFLEASGNKNNAAYQTLLETAASAKQKGDSADLNKNVSLNSLLPVSGSYYRYSGSLTTPPCYEAVQWTVYQNPVKISLDQLKILQSLKVAPKRTTPPPDAPGSHEPDHGMKEEEDEDEEMSDNFRPTQKLNGRVVTGFYDIDVHVTSTSGWHYDGEHGPGHWSDTDKECSGTKQSPIDFATKSIQESAELKRLSFSSSYSEQTSGELINNGHTVMYSLPKHLYFESAGMQFEALQLHFHWARAVVSPSGVTSSGGSEHTVDGQHFPIEMHIVHKKEDDGDDDHTDDLAVLGVFFKVVDEGQLVSDKADEALEKLTEYFDLIQYEDDEFPVVNGPDLMDLLPTNQSYYRYYGSLTTPPCTQSVMWSVFTHPISVSKERFLAFQSIFKLHHLEIVQGNGTLDASNSLLKDTDTAVSEALLSGNFRPTQPLEGRSVSAYSDLGAPSTSHTTEIVLWTLLGLVVFAAILGVTIYCRKRNDGRGAYEGGKLTSEA